MTKADKFRAAIEAIESQEGDAEYMSDMNNWCCVHATQYLPRKNPDGSLYIPSTAMATDFAVVRTTIHVTFNHVVQANNGGSWDNKSIVVLFPYNDVVKKNGNPAQIAGMDTFWSVSPDTGLLLPKSAYVVQPDNNGPLFKIGKDGATYKRDNYTEEEVKLILDALQTHFPDKKEQYDRYENGDISEREIQDSLVKDKRLKLLYEQAKAKGPESEKAFLRGMFEESRFDILSQYLRDVVVKLSMEKMGKKWTEMSDGDMVCDAIYKTGKANGIDSVSNDKGHDVTLFNAIETKMEHIRYFLYGGQDQQGLLQMMNPDAIYDFVKEQMNYYPFVNGIVSSLVENKPFDLEKVYQQAYVDDIKFKAIVLENMVNSDKSFLAVLMDPNGPYAEQSEAQKAATIKEHQERIAENSNLLKSYSKKKTIADYDKNLGETVKRHCKYLAREYDAWRKDLEKQPAFNNLVQKLRTLVATQNMARGGRNR